jgi:hypothetical protein
MAAQVRAARLRQNLIDTFFVGKAKLKKFDTPTALADVGLRYAELGGHAGVVPGGLAADECRVILRPVQPGIPGQRLGRRLPNVSARLRHPPTTPCGRPAFYRPSWRRQTNRLSMGAVPPLAADPPALHGELKVVRSQKARWT